MTSGSWRSALRSACANDRVSTPTSRWLTIDWLSRCRILDRVLDRHDVRRARRVDVVDHRGERRGLAAAGGAGHEHEAALFLRDLLEHRRQAELVDRA